MNRLVLLCLLCLYIGGVWIACKRVDDEPRYPAAPISRLYISYSDLESSDTPQYYNVEVFDPADSTDYFPSPQRSRTQPRQGMGIAFSPHLGLAFQISREDTTVKSFTVNESGGLAPSRNFRDTIFLHSPRAIRYDNRSDRLFITNDDPDSASLNIYYNPVRLVNQQPPVKRLKLGAAPWGLSIAPAPISAPEGQQDSLVLLTMRDTTREVWAFRNSSLIGGEQLVDNASPDYKLAINGASNLRGISYSRNLDMLFLTDLGEQTGSPADGKIYIIENAAAAIRAQVPVTPTRIITGSFLTDPIDIAVADSTDRNQFIYVADRTTKNLLRFPIDANNNTEPLSQRLTLTPEFIYLDLR